MISTLVKLFPGSTPELIGSGTYANVYRVKTADIDIAAKCSKHSIYVNISMLMEWVVNSRINHKSFVRITECRCVDNHIILIMPYVGKSITQHIMAETLIYDADWVRQLRNMATVLRLYNIVHKDISLNNILVSDADKSTIMLCDYGSANHNNPYDCDLETSMPVSVSSLSAMDQECVSFILDMFCTFSRPYNGRPIAFPRLYDRNIKKNADRGYSYMWSHHNIKTLVKLTGYNYNFIQTFLDYTKSSRHTDEACMAIVNAIINHPDKIYDNTQRLFTHS